MFRFTFKTKLTLFFPLAVTIVLGCLLFLVQHSLQMYIKESISAQQFQIVSIMADEIDRKLESTLSPLLALSHKLTPEQISDPDEALAFLLERTEFTSLFDNGMFLFDRRGRIVAEVPLGLSRVGEDFSFRDYLKVTFATKKPHISDPYVSSKSGQHPAIMMTVPILDAGGNVLAVLGGSIDLKQADFWKDIKSRKIGTTGYLFLFDTNRVMISHPDESRIMKMDIPVGANKLLDRAIAGFEGTGETVNSRGLQALTSFNRLKTKDWILGANFPLEEAYAPITNIRNAFLIILPVFSLALFWVMRLYLDITTEPIIKFTRHVEELSTKSGAARIFDVIGDDEVAVLGQAFNQLVRESDFQRNRLEAELDRYERVAANLRKLSAAVEQSPVSIVITDTAGIIEYVNPHFTTLTGYRQEEAVGRNPRILKSDETGDDVYRDLWETILAGGEWRGEFHNRNKDGELYWEQAHISPIRDSNHRITHFIAIKENISERKQLESQLRHSQKMEAIGQLAGGIAHDFNNILTAIIGYSSIMQFKLPDGSPLKKNAEQITATAERGANLTQGLLAFSRKQATNPVVVDLNEILGRVHQLLLRLISEDIHLEMVPSSSDLPIMADSVQIEQILMNLTTNARDALPKGGGVVITTGTVSMDSDFIQARGFGQPGDYAVLTFTDNGIGMSDETLKRIFEPFYTTKELGKGTGLGLSIVYGIIMKHNGFITCQSTIGAGTSFHVYIPLLDQSACVEEKSAPDIDWPEGGADVILVAEDDDDTRLLVKEVLEEFGYYVLEGRDGQEALDIFKNNHDRINLIILDVMMPKLKGREVYDAVRKIDPSMKIIFSSGYAENVLNDQGVVEQGMNYLTKPFTPKELLMKIREVLGDGR